MFSKKATKIDDFVNLCGLLRKHELYADCRGRKKQKINGLFGKLQQFGHFYSYSLDVVKVSKKKNATSLISDRFFSPFLTQQTFII
jgi:hypothetical protein